MGQRDHDDGTIATQAGTAQVSVAGKLGIGGSLTVDAIGDGTNSYYVLSSGGQNNGATATGGSASVTVSGNAASLIAANGITATADAISGIDGYGAGGQATGGTALIEAAAGGTIGVGIDGAINASTYAKSAGLQFDFEQGVGGNSMGGTAQVIADAAMQLGLRSLVGDREVPGEISVAVIGADDPAALAQVQAERLDPGQALNAAYVHANDGSYPDASEFFDRLVARAQLGEPGATRPAEYLVNLAAEQSILGNYAEADALFARAGHASTAGDPGLWRLYRNLSAMHRLNEHDPAGAIAILDAPLPRTGQDFGFTPTRVAGGFIDQPLAQRLQLDNSAQRRFRGGELPLSDWERASLLDAQAAYLRGKAPRLCGNRVAARAALADAETRFDAVRDGQVMSMAWLRADVATARASLADADGKPDAAEGYLRQALAIDAALYPDSAALLAARARLAAAMARHGRTGPALAEYRELAGIAPGVAGGSEALRPLIGPYFDALAAHPEQTGAAADFVVATQALVRPGVARTQAVLARELSAGSDAASDLFRRSARCRYGDPVRLPLFLLPSRVAKKNERAFQPLLDGQSIRPLVLYRNAMSLTHRILVKPVQRLSISRR